MKPSEPSTNKIDWSNPLDLASPFMAKLTDQLDTTDFGNSLSNHLRELTDAQCVILLVYDAASEQHRVLHASPSTIAPALSIEELAALCPTCSSHELPFLSHEIAPDHPLKQVMNEKKIDSIIRLPLQSGEQLNGSLILLNLAQTKHLEEINTLLDHLKPFFSLGLRTFMANETIVQQNEQLEIEVEKRTAELEQFNQELSNSRMAALNMMEDAILAQQKMEVQNQLFESFMNTLPANVFFKDTECRFLSVNQAFGAFCKTDPKDLIGKSESSLFSAAEAEESRQSDLQVMETGKPIQQEQFIAGHWWLTVKAPRYDESGTLAGCYGISWDITARKEAEKSLQLTQFAIDHSTALILRINPDLTFDYVNDAACRMLGYTHEELMSLTVPDIDKDYTKEKSKETWELLRSIKSITTQSRHIRKDGSIFPAETQLNYVEHDGREFVVTFGQNITARMETEAALVESEKKRRDWLTHSPVCTKILDLDFNLQYMSAAGVKALQIEDITKLYGKPYPFSFFPEAFNESMCQDLQHAKNTGELVKNEGKVIGPDGNEIWFNANINPVHNEQGELDYIMVISTDVTERKQLQDALEKRILSLTRPLDHKSSIQFAELFDLKEIQHIQDHFSAASGVASIITLPDGTPITEASNFTRFCMDIVRGTEKGCANCQKSDAALGQHSPDGPIIQPCMSCGLWDAGASIEVGGQHVANWLIGQVRDETQTEEAMLSYAREIGADEAEFITAFREVPFMPSEQFKSVAVALHTLANQLSKMAYQNIQQARFITEQKEAEQKIADLARFPEENTNPVLRISREGILLYANRAANGLLSKSDQKVGTLISEDWNTSIQQSLEAGQAQEIEIDYKDRIFSVTLAPTPKLDYVNVYAHDITDRVEAQRKQEEAQRLLRSIIDTIPSRVWWKDSECRYLGVNINHAHDIGIENPDDLVGKSPRDLFDKELADHYISDDQEVFESGKPKLNIEEPFYLSDGTTQWLETNKIPLRDNKGEIIGTVGTAEDITERRTREKELRRLSTTIEQTPESVVITDPNGIIEYVNPAFEKSSGYTREEALGQSPKIIRSGQHGPEFYHELWRTITDGNIWEGRLVNQNKNGTYYTEEATISPVRDPQGNITNFVAVKRDITEELLREEELQQSQKMEAVGLLAGGVAHDFNNILQAIMGFSEILMMDMEPDSSNHRSASEIHKSAQRAAELTRQLLAFSRKQPTEQVPLNLNDTIHDSEALLDMLLGEQYELKLDLDPTLPEIYADHGQMTQIIMNLAVNARDAMPEGGTLSISSRTEKSQGKNTARSVCLRFSDNGTGMSPEVQGRLFDPFFTTKRLGEGTGLGLSVVYGIIQQSKGSISVESALGEGTTFELHFPIVQLKPEGGQVKESISIMIVDDDIVSLEMVNHILNKAGHKTVFHENPKEALQQYKADPGAVDLLLTDFQMPGMNGIELADELRKITPTLPILVHSGCQDQLENWKQLEQKNYQFHEKPTTVSGLIAAVQAALTAVHP